VFVSFNVIYYKIYAHCIAVGGGVLRRSVWKKSPVWQFSVTNLNINAITAHKFTLEEIKNGTTMKRKVKVLMFININIECISVTNITITV
jgi:hypothetical protein